MEFVEKLPISKRDFYARTGISRGTLESKTGITEDTITKFFATYPSVDTLYILTGTQSSNEPPPLSDNSCGMCQQKDLLIESLREQVHDKQKLIDYLECHSTCTDVQKRKASA